MHFIKQSFPQNVVGVQSSVEYCFTYIVVDFG